MNKIELVKWITKNSIEFENGSDEEQGVASILWLTQMALIVDDLPEFVEYCRAFSYRNESEEELS